MASDSNYTRLTVRDLKDGCYLEYDLKTWKVTAENVYEWDDGRKSKEFKIVSQGLVRFLEIEDFDEFKLFLSERISLSKIQENVSQAIADSSLPPEHITYGGKKYTREGEHAGRFKELGGGEGWEDFMVWDYLDETGKTMISIEEWGPREYEVYYAKFIDESEISDIVRPESSFNNTNNWLGYGLMGLFFCLFFGFCGPCSSSSRTNYTTQTESAVKTPGINQVLEKYKNLPDLTVLLQDMDYEKAQFRHQYLVMIPLVDSTIRLDTTAWINVSRTYFNKHRKNLGMEIANKENFQTTHNVAPPGYSQYVGNERYGRWEEREGTSFWSFYARYRLLDYLLGGSRRVDRRFWSNYDRSYRGRAPYYGSTRQYGTEKYLSSGRGSNTKWSSRSSKYREDAYRASARKRNSRRSRNSSRSSRNSSRSRGGGFGK